MDQEDFNSNTTHFDCSQKDDFSKGHDCDSLLALPKCDFDTHENQMVNRLLETHENNLAGIFQNQVTNHFQFMTSIYF